MRIHAIYRRPSMVAVAQIATLTINQFCIEWFVLQRGKVHGTKNFIERSTTGHARAHTALSAWREPRRLPASWSPDMAGGKTRGLAGIKNRPRGCRTVQLPHQVPGTKIGRTIGVGTLPAESGGNEKMAEEEGFEPPVPCGTHDFESRAFNHSAIPPKEKRR